MTAAGQQPERREVELGFMFDHSLLSETARQTLEASTAALALAQLLVERGVIDEQAYAERRSSIAGEVQEELERRGLGLFVNDEHKDKYELTELPQINCAERIHLCKAACCSFRFPLSRQDVEEGIAQWDLGRPYWIRQEADGYCVHNEPCGHGCRIYEHRPGPCRMFDCRQDKRIWADFDAMLVNPELEQNLAALHRNGSGRRAPAAQA